MATCPHCAKEIRVYLDFEKYCYHGFLKEPLSERMRNLLKTKFAYLYRCKHCNEIAFVPHRYSLLFVVVLLVFSLAVGVSLNFLPYFDSKLSFYSFIVLFLLVSQVWLDIWWRYVVKFKKLEGAV